MATGSSEPTAHVAGRGESSTATARALAPKARPAALVVDDEGGIRHLIRYVLEADHYEVFEAANIEEAEARLTSDTPLELLIVDHTLGDQTAGALVHHAHARHPKVAILVTSGRLIADLQAEYGDVPCHFLPKPFTLDTLQHAIHEVITHAA